MTDYFASLDPILAGYRGACTSAYLQGDYLVACHFLYLLNCAHPKGAYINDMTAFKIRGDSNTIAIRTRLNIPMKAKAYCDYWSARLEIAMSDFRTDNQEKYNRV